MPTANEKTGKHRTDRPLSKPARVERAAPLYEQIQKALWGKIVSGDILPGQHLSDRLLAEQLKVSRTPVREAMRQLARDGVLITLDSGGYQVRPVDRAGLLDLYVCRSVLAAAATKLTAQRSEKKLVERLLNIMSRKEEALKARNAEAVMKHASQFHQTIIDASENTSLINIMERLNNMILFYRINLLKKSLRKERTLDSYFTHLETSHQRHLEIITAIEQRRSALAAKLMERHLIGTSRDMDRIFADQDVELGSFAHEAA